VPRWSSATTPSRRGAAGARSSTAVCEAHAVAVSFLQDSVRTVAGDRHSLRWTEEGVVEHSIQHLVGTRTRWRGRSPELGVGEAMVEAAREKENGTGGWPHGGKDGGGVGGCRRRGTRLVGDGHDPGPAAPGRVWERQGKREKGESREAGGGPSEAWKRKEEKENGLNSNLKLILQIYSNLI
jgi:hypothetical protein